PTPPAQAVTYAERVNNILTYGGARPSSISFAIRSVNEMSEARFDQVEKAIIRLVGESLAAQLNNETSTDNPQIPKDNMLVQTYYEVPCPPGQLSTPAIQ
ncbi:MAG TPA: hypothetical protein VGM08_02815, partial [Candidatus Saccharimonadales bacterium]